METYSSEEMTEIALDFITYPIVGYCVVCGNKTTQRLFNPKTKQGDFVCHIDREKESLDCKNVWRYRIRHGIEWCDYHSYIESEEWKLKATRAKLLVGNKCENCCKSIGSILNAGDLDAHHINYVNLYYETKRDIRVLCRNCHSKEHGK